MYFLTYVHIPSTLDISLSLYFRNPMCQICHNCEFGCITNNMYTYTCRYLRHIYSVPLIMRYREFN